MAARMTRIGATPLTAALGLVMAASLLTACSDDGDPAPAEDVRETAASDEEGAGSEDGADDAAEEETGGDAAEDGAADAQATAQDVVAGWVTAVIDNRPEDACLLMALPAEDGGDPEVGTAETCAEGGPMHSQLTGLAETFTPADAAGVPTVTVTGEPESETSATFPIEQIDVGGQTLQEVVLSHSEGVSAEDVDMSVEAGAFDGVWYVTDLGLSIG
ncbi:hypothetical protein ACL02R_17790 [Streptomyces sp. MS19]|uniref:hypothetical protein n=1 Tax=Streptomyces sp. MS19 TaxID=3385972 RepID=UPI0039A3298E